MEETLGTQAQELGDQVSSLELWDSALEGTCSNGTGRMAEKGPATAPGVRGKRGTHGAESDGQEPTDGRGRGESRSLTPVRQGQGRAAGPAGGGWHSDLGKRGRRESWDQAGGGARGIAKWPTEEVGHTPVRARLGGTMRGHREGQVSHHRVRMVDPER